MRLSPPTESTEHPDYGLATTLAEKLIGHRIVVAVAIALITALAAAGASRVGFDSDIEIWFLEDEPNLLKYKQFIDRFDADEIAIIGIFADDVFAPEVLSAIQKLSEEAADLEQAYKVRSLANVKIARSRGRSDRSCSDVSVAALIGNAFRDSADRKTHVTIARAGARFS